MLSNHIKMAYRSLSRSKSYGFLNLLGLSTGLTCFALIAGWVMNELSYDKFHEKHDRIYRIAGKVTTDSEVFEQAVTSPPMAPALVHDFPEVENAVRLDKNDCIVRRGDKQFSEDGVLFTDPSFFDIFSYHLTVGNAKTALNNPYQIILTQSMAGKYFGEENPLGKTITLFLYDEGGKGAEYKVTGVMPDPPENTHFTFNFLGSFSTFAVAHPESQTSAYRWFENGFYTYVLLKEGADYQDLERKLPDFAQRYMGDKMQEMNMFYTYSLQPLTDIHLHSDLRYEIQATGNMNNIYVFATIGLFILLIACINYMNLATARSLTRAKEVGVKKVVGAAKLQLVWQFLTESFLTTGIALLFAFLLVELFRPSFEVLTGKAIENLYSIKLLMLLGITAVFVGLFSGLYPAFFISAFKPMQVLRGAFKSTPIGIGLRKGLVILQFTISIVLLIGIGIVNSQMQFIQNKDLGFNKEELVVLDVNGFSEVQHGIEAFRVDLMSNPAITGVTTSRSLIVDGLSNSYIETVDGQGNPVSSSIYRLQVGPEYLDVYDMKIVAGRTFNHNIASDTVSAFIVNEAAVQAFGWGEAQKAIGKPITQGDIKGKIIGVVHDFHFASLQKPIEPLAITVTPESAFSRITVRIATQHVSETVQFIERIWKKQFPQALWQYSFLNERLARQYTEQRTFRRVFLTFVVLSLLVACLGLFGLASYATEQRVKEIGIRKVLGASVSGIIVLLSRSFLKLVAAAFVVACPIAYYVMTQWLQDFAYRIEMAWDIFIWSGMLTLIIAFLTVSVQAIKAALSNPVESLRYE